MARQRFWERVAASGGAICGVLLTAGLVMQGIAFSGAEEESRAQILARFSDGGNELWAEVGGLLVGLATFFLLAFVGSVRATLRPLEGARSVFSTAAVGGGVAMAALLMVSSATSAAAFSSYDFYDAYRVDPDTVLLMQSVSFYAQGFALVGGGVLVGAIALVAMRTRLLPRWLAISGLVLAAVSMLGEWAQFVFLPLPLLVLWIMIVSIVLASRGRHARATGNPTARASESPAVGG